MNRKPPAGIHIRRIALDHFNHGDARAQIVGKSAKTCCDAIGSLDDGRFEPAAHRLFRK
jgi:hypothetical protein